MGNHFRTILGQIIALLQNKINFNKDKGNNIEIVVSGIKHEFNFDKLYTDEVSQEEIFKSCTSPM